MDYTIEEGDHDIRLDRWFKRHRPGFQHALLEKMLRKGEIRLDGKKAKTSDRIQAGQVLSCPEWEEESVAKPKRAPDAHEVAELRRWVLYKDANVILLNKPFGLAVQGGTKISRSLDDMLDGLTFDASERPRLVHRIDRDTSGILVLARSRKAAAWLAKGFAGKGIEKTYWALVNGSPLPPKGVIDLPLSKGPHPNPLPQAGEGVRKFPPPAGARGVKKTAKLFLAERARERTFETVQIDEDDGKPATTRYRVLDSLARKFALMELQPLTGRTHQLRVHMAAISCPIVGDHKYGGSNVSAESLGVEDKLHLHARRIVIPALPGGKVIDVVAPLPPHMVTSFEALGLDVPKGKK